MASGATVTDIKSHNKGSQLGIFKSRYPPDQFLIPGQDQNGQSVRIYCRVVPLLERAIEVIHGNHKFPFKSKGDLMRWCVKVGVEKLDAMEPCVGSVMAQAEAMFGILRDEELNHTFLTLFNTMTATIGMHIQAQALGEARRVVSMMKQQIDKMDDGYWRQRYLTELESKFGYLLRNVGGAGLGEHEDHGPDRGTEGEDD